MPPVDATPDADALQRRCDSQLQDIQAWLARQQASLAKELEAVRERLRAAGLATPEAIRTAYDALDAGEREHLQRQLRAQRGQDDMPPAPRVARRHRGRML